METVFAAEDAYLLLKVEDVVEGVVRVPEVQASLVVVVMLGKTLTVVVDQVFVEGDRLHLDVVVLAVAKA